MLVVMKGELMNKDVSGALREFWIEPPELKNKNSKSSIWVESNDFYCFQQDDSGLSAKEHESAHYLLVGFDTEFKTPSVALSPAEVKEEGKARSLILSYQFHAKTSEGLEWSGICCPEGDERITLQDFMIFVLGTGARVHGVRNLPNKVYLVGHFTRADIPAFADFQELTKYMSAVRSTFVSTDSYVKVDVPTPDDESVALKLYIRDTMLLTPQSSKSLKALGELVGIEKVELTPDREEFKRVIRNMDKLRYENWPLFKRYALTDAEICVRYMEKVIDQYKAVTGNFKVPITLTGIGVDLLLKSWRDEGLDYLWMLGKERVKQSYFSKSKGRYIYKTSDVELDLVHRETVFVTECYHGGRNEQFWFGPCFKDDWSDFDLSSAYPTAMSLIGLPDWYGLHDSKNLDDYGPETLGFVQVEFEFPVGTRYPTLPVRTDNGLIFPLKGVSCCAAPELYVARKLGAQLTIKHGVIVPTDNRTRIFGDFIKDCINKRIDAGSKTLEGLFWKEISNSTYGKTAQGLHEKRVYDMRDREGKALPQSKITNAYYASYITSFTRAVLGEIMNSVPANRMVFSCTTDGFICNMTDDEAVVCQQGVLSTLYAKQRRILTKDSTVLDKKHAVKRPLGWRTRGQATLDAGDVNPNQGDFHIVLAKGGIYTPPEFEEDDEQNAEIVRLFFERTPETRIVVEAKTGVRDMVEYNADFVEKIFSKRLNMEYDWKRAPFAVTESTTYGHIAFSTQPWSTKEQFFTIRDNWNEYVKDDPHCLKTMDDFNLFSSYVETRTFLEVQTAKYLRKKNGDVNRLRQQLCSAYKNSAAGLKPKVHGLNDLTFAELLTSVGIPCKKSDVENGRKKEFVPYSCPPTEQVEVLLMKLQVHLKNLEPELFLYESDGANPIKLSQLNDCPFVNRVD
jgi:DNA polymerase type B, organellar and viral